MQLRGLLLSLAAHRDDPAEAFLRTGRLDSHRDLRAACHRVPQAGTPVGHILGGIHHILPVDLQAQLQVARQEVGHHRNIAADTPDSLQEAYRIPDTAVDIVAEGAFAPADQDNHALAAQQEMVHRKGCDCVAQHLQRQAEGLQQIAQELE